MALKPVAAPEAMARHPSNTTGMCSQDVFAIPSFYTCPTPSVLPNYFSVFLQHSTFFSSALDMEALASASSVIAVGSLAIQLAETIQKLVEFWKAVQNAPAEINSRFNELKCLSKVLEKVTEHHLGEELASSATYALLNCQTKIAELRKEASTAAANLSSHSSYKRKWSAVQITLKKAQLDSLRNALENAKSKILIFQSISIQSDLRALREITLRTLESVKDTSFSSHRGNIKIDHVKMSNGNPIQGLYQKGESRKSSQDLFSVGEGHPMHRISESLPDGSKSHITNKTYKTLHFSSLALPSPLWAIQSELRTRKVLTKRGSHMRAFVETDSSCVLYPSNFLRKLGMSYGIWVQTKSITGWQFSLQPFIAVPSDSAIFQFCRDGNVSAIKVLLSLGQASVRDRDPLGRTPLWIAAESLQLEAVELLLQQGADPHTRDWYSRRLPISAMRTSKEVDVQKRLSVIELIERWSTDGYEADDIGLVIGLNLHAYRPERPWQVMPLFLSDRKNAALMCVKRLLPLLPADDVVLSSILIETLWLRYDQEILYSMLRDIKGMLHDNEYFTMVQLSIYQELPLRDPVAMRMIVERSTNVQLHQCQEKERYYWFALASTPTLLALYQPAMFLAWRNILHDVGLGVEEFVRDEMEQPMVKEEGWTEQSLMALFNYEFLPPVSVPRLGFPACERCGEDDRRTVDLGWRRRIRDFRCGRVLSTKDITDDNNSAQSEEDPQDAKPYNIVCWNKCVDDVCVAWGYENDGTDEPDFPPYDPEWREKAKLRIEEVEFEDEDHGSRKIPGAFVE